MIALSNNYNQIGRKEMKKTKKILSVILAATIAFGALTACGSSKKSDTTDKEQATIDSTQTSETTEGSDERRTIHFMGTWAENDSTAYAIRLLADEYTKTHPNVTLEIETVQQSDIDTKLLVLAASDSLPDIFAYSLLETEQTLVKADQIMCAEDVFQELGIKDSILDTVYQGKRTLAGTDKMYGIPASNNIEGIFYNKKIFNELGLEVPKTVEEFEVVCDKLATAGYIPLSLAGKEKWPNTRILANLVARKLGYDAPSKLVSGEIPFSDPQVVEQVQKIQDWANKGYFGPGVNSVDTNVSYDQLLTEKAGMLYTGSWFSKNLGNPETNKLDENVGFFSFPAYTDGVGTTADYISSYGLTLGISKKAYDPQLADFIQYVFLRYGDVAMENVGLITGFNLEEQHENIPQYTQMIIDEMSNVKNASVWLEYNWPTKISDIERDNMQLVINGSLKAEDFCKTVDVAIEANK